MRDGHVSKEAMLATNAGVSIVPIYGQSGVVISYMVTKKFRTKTDMLEWLERFK